MFSRRKKSIFLLFTKLVCFLFSERNTCCCIGNDANNGNQNGNINGSICTNRVHCWFGVSGSKKNLTVFRNRMVTSMVCVGTIYIHVENIWCCTSVNCFCDPCCCRRLFNGNCESKSIQSIWSRQRTTFTKHASSANNLKCWFGLGQERSTKITVWRGKHSTKINGKRTQ